VDRPLQALSVGCGPIGCDDEAVIRPGVSAPGSGTDPADGDLADGDLADGELADGDLADADAPGADPAGGDSRGRSLVRNTRTIATATVASRLTGFVRTAVMAAVLGVGGFNQAFTIANTLPNNLYEFLLGGILTSTLVPLLVQARERDRDGGLAYAQKLFSLLVYVLVAVSVLAVLAAPLLIRLYTSADVPADQVALASTWARFFLPQIVFYGVTALFGALLNTRGRYAAPMWAPVLNNVLVIAVFAVFAFVPGPDDPGPGDLSTAQLVTLGVGTTAGVVAMTLALAPALRSVGVRLRLRADLHGLGLRQTGRLAAWTLVYVAVTQLSYLVLTRLASDDAQLPTYTLAFTVWQLPHAVVAVSVITALLPAMSRHAVRGRLDRIRTDVDRGVRLSTLVLVPSALAFVVLGRDIAVLLFGHGATSPDEAARVGWTLAVFAVGLVPFSVYQLQSRAFYAMKDTRTPALVQVAVSAVLVAVDVLLSVVVTGPDRVYALAAGHAVAYVTGVALSVAVLRRRIGRPPRATAQRSSTPVYLLRLVIAGVVAVVVAGALSFAVGGAVPDGPARAGLALAIALPLGGIVYAAMVVALRVEEARALVDSARARLTR